MTTTKTYFAIFAIALYGTSWAGANESDPDLTNYKSGISLLFGAGPGGVTKGIDYYEEYLYHDKLVTDRKIVYIKSDTLIRLEHNNLNTKAKGNGNVLIGQYGEDGIPNSNDEGTIRFKLDGDLNFNMRWADFPNERILARSYTEPFNFANLMYRFDNTKVLGSTGSNLPKPNTENRETYYHYGILDKFGDEWHTLTVADDDSNFVTQSELQSSDGKIFYFVVDPKTPCISFHVQGDAQFYTTPPKSYFVPQIHEMTTVISERSGTVAIEVGDIFGNDIHYRIVSAVDDPATPYFSTNSSSITLAHTDFPEGVSYLQYFYNENFVKTRKVIRNPSFPSESESHGYLLFKDKLNKDAVKKRIEDPYFSKSYSSFLKYDFWNQKKSVESKYRSGHRNVWTKQLEHAFVATMEGMDFKGAYERTFAETAKFMLIEHPRSIDPVGFELPHTFSGIPSKELHYRGYYDVNQIIGSIFAYDILISEYRSDMHTNGITPVEDFLIRDNLASFAHECMLWQGGYTGMFPGMWGTSRLIGGALCAIGMPNYSSNYYGTSGFKNKGRRVEFAPYPDEKPSWTDVFLNDDKIVPSDYPNQKYAGTIEDMFTEEGYFKDRIPYYSSSLMGSGFQILYNTLRIHYPSKEYSRLHKSFELALTGKLQGTKFTTESDVGDKTYPQLLLMNEKFPEFYEIGTQLLEDDNGVPLNESYPNIFSFVWYKPSKMHIKRPSELR